jgi:polyhydroxyalkanoate synthesis regulator phasin
VALVDRRHAAGTLLAVATGRYRSVFREPDRRGVASPGEDRRQRRQSDGGGLVLEGLRGYLQLASGLTDVTRERARAAARALVAQGEAGVEAVVPGSVRSQVSGLTDDLMATSKANRDLLVNLVRGEVERSVARLGLVSADQLAAAERRAKGLQLRVSELENELRRTSGPARKTAAKRPAATKPAAKKTAARKPVARKTAPPRPAVTTTDEAQP